MNNCFVILAGGKGRRFDKKKPKQFFKYKNKEIVEHSIEKSFKSKLFKNIVLVVDNLNKYKYKKYPKILKIIKGGKERSDSSTIALKYLKKFKPTNVYIHDAARPNFSIKLLKSLNHHLKKNKAVVPKIISNDAIKYKVNNQYYNVHKKNIIFTQTPQAFRFNDLYKITKNQKKKFSDESSIFIDNNLKIKFINGEYNNYKITHKSDLTVNDTRFGIGFDIHKLIKGKKLFLGGVQIPFHSGLIGHSDGDVILHAVIDALLGALNKKDIGTYFPSTKNKFKNIRSPKMLKPILEILNNLGYQINNLDINLICEKPKVSKLRNKVINSLSKILSLEKKKINLKGKTVEKLGLIGKEKAIASEVIISITKDD